jgi:hypothetical protein
MKSVLLVTIGLAVAGGLLAQQTGQPRPSLNPQDYIDIEQLVARYVHAVDRCTNGGYDYADLYTDDGEFSVAEAWGAAPEERRFSAKGRDALAVAAGGGPDGCRDPSSLLGYGIHHVSTAHVITATASGAIGMSTLLALGVGRKQKTIELLGGYEAVDARRADGWRFQSRVHVLRIMSEAVRVGDAGVQGQ